MTFFNHHFMIIFLDIAVSYCSKFYYQLCTFHTVNNYIPLVFFIFPSKETIVYERALKGLIDICDSKLFLSIRMI